MRCSPSTAIGSSATRTSPSATPSAKAAPRFPPGLLAKVLLLAYREGLWDERAMEALRFDLRWRVALDLPIDHPGFHPTSLVRYRVRLRLYGKERLIFARSHELAPELGLIEGEAEQIVDSTPMLGAAAVQDTATMVRSGVRRLLDAVQASDEGAAEELASGLRFDYSRPREKPTGDREDKASREALLAEVARDAVRALRAVEEDEELASEAEIAEAAKLLREIVGQEFEVGDDEVPRSRRGRRTRQIGSAADPEMRHGRQTAARPFTGYKIHAAAAAEAPILTSITLSPATERDHLTHTRPRIERLLGLIVHRYWGRKSRYLGARKISVPGRLDRRPGQPPPDRGRAAGPGGIGASRRSEPSREAARTGGRQRRPETLFFSGLTQMRVSACRWSLSVV